MSHCWSSEVISGIICVWWVIKTSTLPQQNFASLQFYLLKDQLMWATWCHCTHLCLRSCEFLWSVCCFLGQGSVKFEVLVEDGFWETSYWECKLFDVRFYLGCLGVLSIWCDLDWDRSRYHKLRYFFDWWWFDRPRDRSSHIFAWCWGTLTCWTLLGHRGSTANALFLSTSVGYIVFRCFTLVNWAQKLLSDSCGFLGKNCLLGRGSIFTFQELRNFQEFIFCAQLIF